MRRPSPRNAFTVGLRSSLWLPITMFALLAGAACSSSTTSPALAGGPVSGPKDAHCTTAQPTSMSSCSSSSTASMSVQHTAADTTAAADGGSGDGAASAAADSGAMDMSGGFGATMYNAAGSDDDCKYDVQFSVTPIFENQDVTSTVKVNKRTDGSPATGAKPRVDVFLGDTHLAPNSGQKATEGPTGTYAIGPIRFDKSGRWTVRFHFFEDCDDAPADSPHGHAAFYIDVP